MRESTPFVVVEIVDGVAEIAEFLVESARAFVEEIATRESNGAGWWRVFVSSSTRRRRSRRFARTPRRSRASSRDRRGANRRRDRRRGWTTAGWTARRPSSIVARRGPRPVPRRTRRRVRVLEMEGVRPPPRPSPSAPSRVPPGLSRGESSCRRRARVTTTTMGYPRRARGRLARRREPRRDWFSARRRVWRRRRPFPSGVGTTSMGFWPPAFVASGLAPPGPTSHDTTGQCSCLAATCNGVSPRASLARAETPASSSECSRTRRTDGRFPRAAAANSAESAAEASSAGGGIVPARTNNASIDTAVPKCRILQPRERTKRGRPSLRRRLSLAPRDECGAERSRAVSCARDDDADERTDQAPRDTQRRQSISQHTAARDSRGDDSVYSKSRTPRRRDG